MADYETTGEGLQKLVRLGKKRPMPFAFCPGSGGDNDSFFATHRTKPPEIIAKSARKASGQSKVCFGTFTVEAKLITLVLIKELPLIAKKLKKHLRHERLSLNVQVVDAMGNVLDSDIDDLTGDDALDDHGLDEAEPDETELYETGSDEIGPDEEDSAAAQGEAGFDDDTPSARELAVQLKSLQPGIMALQGDTGTRMRAALAGVVGLLKAGDLLRAHGMITAIERAIARQSATAPDPVPNPVQRLAALKSRLGPISGTSREKLTAALGLAAKHIAAGDTAKAVQTMDAVEQAMTRVAAGSEPAPDLLAASRQAWIKARSQMRGEVEKLKSAIDAKLAALGGMEKTMAKTDVLFSYLAPLDDRLETALASLAVTPDGAARVALKTSAQKILAEYNAELDSGFFMDTDENNGFTPVSLRAPAKAALQQVATALA